MEIGDCPFRHDVIIGPTGETSQCRLLEQLAAVSEILPIRVPRNACAACVQYATEGMLVEHPVLSSLLYQQCESTLADQITASKLSDADFARLTHLRMSAEQAICRQQERRQPLEFLPSCDIVLVADESTAILTESIASLLDQIDVAPFLHLVDTGTAGSAFDGFSSCWNVRRYRLPSGTTALAAVHEIIESLRSPFLAIQSPSAISDPQRLSQSILALVDGGAEIFVTPCEGTLCLPVPTAPDRSQIRQVSPMTMAMRRATFVDMGGIAHGAPDAGIEFLSRAIHEDRRVIFGDIALVRMLVPESPLCRVQSPNDWASNSGTRSGFARGFPRVRTACDVVVPFFGHLHYVEEALNGLIEQDGAELVIHLIDDATPGNTTEFLRHWSRHPNVRVYRNRENIGQFQSFNSVSRFFETELAAVQDADDVSLPHRICWAGQMLHYTGADFFGGAVELFGDGEIAESPKWNAESPTTKGQGAIRRSFYPARGQDYYFVENPTAVFRVSAFRELGGFADFGDRLLNRTSLDTEFQSRGRFHKMHFALSRKIVVRYRVHSNSATRDDLTGWGTTARTNAGFQLMERCKLYQRGGFLPKSFGSLGSNSQITERF